MSTKCCDSRKYKHKEQANLSILPKKYEFPNLNAKLL